MFPALWWAVRKGSPSELAMGPKVAAAAELGAKLAIPAAAERLLPAQLASCCPPSGWPAELPSSPSCQLQLGSWAAQLGSWAGSISQLALSDSYT